jgi:SRSO17 transposase
MAILEHPEATILNHPEAVALLDDAVISTEQLEELSQRLHPFLQRFAPLFQRAEQRVNAQFILQGKLSCLSRKTCEPIAHLFGVRRENLQDFVGVSPWQDRPILDALRQDIATAWNDPNGVLTGDGSDFPKKGEHSCGVKRQHCGRLGKVDNCQAGIFLGYACRRGHVLLDHRLFLPPEWAADQERRAETKVPDNVVYRERWEILLDQLDANRDLSHSWFTCDSEFGRVNALREGLRQRQERYVVDVREDLRLRDLRAKPPQRQGKTGRIPSAPPTTHAREWAAAQPASAWKRFTLRDGEKRPLVVEAAESMVETFEDHTRVGAEERFCVIRTVDNPEPKTWYTLSNAGAEVPLARVVWAHGQRHWQEAALREGKSEVGLDEYEVRSWVGWHHHMTLSLLALWFLALERDRGQKRTPALTVSVLREAMSRLLVLQTLTREGIVRELNETLRRKEEARIYHYYHATGRYPPRRTEAADDPADAEPASSRDPPKCKHLQ